MIIYYFRINVYINNAILINNNLLSCKLLGVKLLKKQQQFSMKSADFNLLIPLRTEWHFT